MKLIDGRQDGRAQCDSRRGEIGEAGGSYGGRAEKGAHGSKIPAILFRRRGCGVDEVLPALVVEGCGALRLGGHGVALVALPFGFFAFLALVLSHAAALADRGFAGAVGLAGGAGDGWEGG